MLTIEPYEPVLSLAEFQGAMECDESTASLWYPHMDRAMHLNGTRQYSPVCAFLATMAYESLHLTRPEESLDYSTPGRLVQVWPSRFSIGGARMGTRDPTRYVHKPVELAEYVYGGRMGNGPEGSGDGWMYRGRGPGHTTGKEAYAKLSGVFGKNFVTEPDLLKEPRWGSITSARQWRDKGCNELALAGNFDRCVLLWNGGFTDMDMRRTIHNRVRQVLSYISERLK